MSGADPFLPDNSAQRPTPPARPGTADPSGLRTFLFRTVVEGVDAYGRRFIYNRDLPPVGRSILDVPYGSNAAHRLDIYVPAGTGPWPCAVYLHGGGWIVGRKENHTRFCRWLASEGFLAINANYRLAPRHPFPAQMQDTAALLAWVRDHATDYGGTPDSVIILGDSAGAHLASWYAAALDTPELFELTGVCATMPKSSIRGLVHYYGVYNLVRFLQATHPIHLVMPESLLAPNAQHHPQRAVLASPIMHLTRDFIPSLLCAGEADGLFRSSAEFAESLKTAGAEHEVLFFSRKDHPDARHVFLYRHRRRCSIIAMERTLEFMRRRLEQA